MVDGQFDWTDEAIATVKRMLLDGQTSGMIALAFGVPRNSIIGKVHRDKGLSAIGFGHTQSEKAKRQRINERNKALEIKKVKHTFPAAALKKKLATPKRINPAKPKAVPEAASLNVLLVDLEPRQCRWATNDAPAGEPHLFCGHETVEGQSWCPHHRLRAFGPGTESERSALRVAVKLGQAA